MRKPDLILLATRGLPDCFRTEDLAVAAWKLFPESFGMKGEPYPCHNKLGPIVHHKRIGLVALGLLDRVRLGKTSAYRLSAAGLRRRRALEQEAAAGQGRRA